MFFLIVYRDTAGAARTNLDNSLQAQQKIAQGVDGLWKDVLGGGIYGAIATLGTGIAVFTLTIMMLQFAKLALEEELNKENFAQLIWPLLVAILLANNSALLAKCTLGLRGVINHTNELILQNTSAQISLKDAYERVTKEIGATQAIQAIASQCDGITNPQEQTECLDIVARQMQTVAKMVEKPSQPFLDWVNDLIDNPAQTLINSAGAFGSAVLENSMTGLLMLLSLAFQWFVEIALILTALLGPLATGGSLLPMGTRSIVLWLVGFFTVGFWKLCYNIIIGLVAALLTNAQQINDTAFAYCAAIFSPLFATLLASGAGLAIVNSLNNLAGTALRAAITFGLK